MKKKVLVIIGSTSSGKTGLAVQAALKYNGEIISADSRQVYKGMDIGTGKDLYEYGNTPYHLIDVADPKEQFTLADFQKKAYSALDNILSRKKLPIIAGGTGMYAQALVDAYDLSAVSANENEREVLEIKDKEELFEILKKYNSKFAENLNNSDKNNKRRLVRYIEMAKIGGKDLQVNKTDKKKSRKYDFFIIGLRWPREMLHSRIHKRLIDRLEKEAMVEEVENLYREGVSWKRLESFGLEYRYISRYLRDILTYDEMVAELHRAIKKFAKQQSKWYKRWEKQGAKIHWFEGESDKLWGEVEKFLS